MCVHRVFRIALHSTRCTLSSNPMTTHMNTHCEHTWTHIWTHMNTHYEHTYEHTLSPHIWTHTVNTLWTHIWTHMNTHYEHAYEHTLSQHLWTHTVITHMNTPYEHTYEHTRTQMHTVFNPGGDVIYGILRYFEEEHLGSCGQFSAAFFFLASCGAGWSSVESLPLSASQLSLCLYCSRSLLTL
jgi:hypothetical protein